MPPPPPLRRNVLVVRYRRVDTGAVNTVELPSCTTLATLKERIAAKEGIVRKEGRSDSTPPAPPRKGSFQVRLFCRYLSCGLP